MLRFRLHPTSSGLFFGLAVIALWALLWVWFLFSLGAGQERQARLTASAPTARMESLSRSGAPKARA